MPSATLCYRLSGNSYAPLSLRSHGTRRLAGMPDIGDPRQQAAGKRRAREQRIRDLRSRIVAVAVALFVAAWVGLYIQLVSGHDPAFAGAVAPVAQSADPEAAGDDSSDDGWSDAAVGNDGWSSSDGATSGAATEPAPVTTGQS
jgi:hypothetical protein